MATTKKESDLAGQLAAAFIAAFPIMQDAEYDDPATLKKRLTQISSEAAAEGDTFAAIFLEGLADRIHLIRNNNP